MFLNQAGVSVSAAVSGSSAMVSAVFAVVSLIVGLGALLFFGWSSKRSFSPLIRLGWLRDPMVLLHLIAYMLLPIVGIGFGYVITNVAQLSLGTSAGRCVRFSARFSPRFEGRFCCWYFPCD